MAMESESTFVAPEGVYSVVEEHKPALVAPHAVTAPPSLFPTRLSAVSVRFPPKPGSSQGLSLLLGGRGRDRDRDHTPAASNPPTLPQEDGVSLSSSDTPVDDDNQDGSLPSDGTPNVPFEPPSLFTQPSIRGKRKSISRPKHNMRTTSSSFVTRLQSAEGLSRALASKHGEVTFLFYNSGKTFYWTEASAKAKEPLAKITFSAHPTCHDINLNTVSPTGIDIVIGFHSGDLVWFDPISSRYVRINKQGCITNSPCTAVHWVPSSPTLFLVSHADGTIIVYDKEREDGTFTAEQPPTATTAQDPTSPPSTPWNPLDTIFVSVPPWHPVTLGSGLTGPGAMRNEKEVKASKNPVSHWRISKRKVVDFTFSSDVNYVAAISDDGCLRVIDALAEQLVDCYASYFGALTCVAWSPDGRFILVRLSGRTGGQDDLVTIISPWEQRIVARCQGHSSFITALAFDESRCDGRTYRFASVGEDKKLVLWDFSSGALHRPKATNHQRVSMSSTPSLGLRRRGDAISSTLHLPPGSVAGESTPLFRYHPAPSRQDVAIVQPVLVKTIEGDILTDVAFLPSALLSASKAGRIKVWVRPLAMRPRRSKVVRDTGHPSDG